MPRPGAKRAGRSDLDDGCTGKKLGQSGAIGVDDGESELIYWMGSASSSWLVCGRRFCASAYLRALNSFIKDS